MTIEHLKKKLSCEKHIIGALEIVYEKVATPNILGIYEEAGLWYIYDTNEHGNIVILDSGNEDEMTDALYRRIVKIEKRLYKKGTA